MKNLKIKLGLFSLLAILAVSVFLTSCEQENAVNQETPDEIQQVMGKMIQDTDVNEFIDASLEFDKAMRERVEANQEQFDAYMLTNDNDKINQLIKFDEIVGLYEKMITTASIVSAKFPQIDEIDEEAVEKFYLNNPQFVEIVQSNDQYVEIESRGVCNSGWWNNAKYGWCVYNCSKAHLPHNNSAYLSCAGNCYWKYCTGYL